MILTRAARLFRRKIKDLRMHKLAIVEIGNDRYEVLEYQTLVFRRPLMRFLHYSSPSCGGYISAVDLVNPANMPIMTYFKPFCDKFLSNKRSNALLLGVGGGGILRYIAENFQQCQVTGVELKADFISLAKRYFWHDLQPSVTARIKTVVADARDFANDDKQEYELIISDICTAQRSFYEIYDDDFSTALHRRLASDGVVVFNMLSTPAKSLAEIIDRFRKEFGFVELLTCRNSNRQPVIVAGNTDAVDKVRELLSVIAPRNGIVAWTAEFI